MWTAGCAGTGAPAAEVTEEGASGGRRLTGQISNFYRGRFTRDEYDSDLYTTVSTEIGDPAEDRWTYHFLGTAFLSLSGKSSAGGDFFSLWDTYDGDVQVRVFDAYADYNGEDGIERVRIGRQLDYATPTLAWFDGASITTAELGERNVSAGAYGGSPVHEFAADGNVMTGVFGQARPWRGGRLRADYMHIEEEYLGTERLDDLFSLGARQAFGPELSLEGDYARLNGGDRDMRLAGTWLAPGQELVVRASFYRLLATQKQQVIELDPFYESLLELFPFWQTRLLVSRSFSDTWVLEAGVDLRRVENADQIGQFNRDFDRVFATVSVLEGLPWELEGSVTADSYDSEGNDVQSFGADLTRRLGARDEASVGTFYSLYKHDLFGDEERDDVRTWFLRFRRGRGERRTLDVRYEYENSAVGEFHTLRLGTTWTF